MSSPSTIQIENVFYMLAYAFKAVGMDIFKNVGIEDFDNADDLLAAILRVGIDRVVKQGFHRTFEPSTEDLTTVRGRLLMPATIRHYVAHRQRLSCEFDAFTVNNVFNQVLKTTLGILVRTPDVKSERRNALKRVLPFFEGVNTVSPQNINWSGLRYQRNNRSYLVLMNLCRLVIDGCIMGSKDGSGNFRLSLFDEKQLQLVYEGFLREYYRYNHPEIDVPGAKELDWDASAADQARLPTMKTDVLIRHGNKVLIIDAKLYGQILQHQYGSGSYRNNNIYQINTYVQSAKADCVYSGCVIEGLLLYAQTNENVLPDSFVISGNKIGINAIDLNNKFQEISAQLDAIVTNWIGGA